MSSGLPSIAIRTAAKRARYEVAQGVLAIMDEKQLEVLDAWTRIRSLCESFEPVKASKRS